MIKAIIFDCFGVLTGDLWKEFMATLPTDQHKKAHDLNYALDSGHMTHSDFYQAIHELTGREPKEVEDIINSDMQKNQALLTFIKELSKKYKLGILSNISSSWITDHFLNKQEAALFDAMVFSYQIGVTKPDPKAFKAISSKLDCAVNECLLVDDNPSNCAAAKQLGMKAIVYKNFTDFKQTFTDLVL